MFQPYKTFNNLMFCKICQDENMFANNSRPRSFLTSLNCFLETDCHNSLARAVKADVVFFVH